jgi:hypothetical protein
MSKELDPLCIVIGAGPAGSSSGTEVSEPMWDRGARLPQNFRGLFAAWASIFCPPTRVGALEKGPRLALLLGAGDRTRTGDPHLGNEAGLLEHLIPWPAYALRTLPGQGFFWDFSSLYLPSSTEVFLPRRPVRALGVMLCMALPRSALTYGATAVTCWLTRTSAAEIAEGIRLRVVGDRLVPPFA